MPKFLELAKSKGYADGRERVAGWKKRLEKADAKGAIEIRNEKEAFFSEMRGRNPGLYAFFKINDKLLSEKIVKKLTGRDIIID